VRYFAPCGPVFDRATVQWGSKNHALMKPSFSVLAVLCGLALLAMPAAAERADRNKPMNVEADNLRHDEKSQISVFTGNVVVSKGTLVLRGARLEVRQDPQGNQFGVMTAAPGQRAFFRQKREGLDEFIEGEAELVEYDGRQDTVRFQRRAEMRRLRGATLADEISGAVILYENQTDRFTVDGQLAAVAGVGESKGRVRAVLAPRTSASAPAAAPATLRPTGSMGGDRQ
jgi:lipopolysaccharide export system protein LptA